MQNNDLSKLNIPRKGLDTDLDPMYFRDDSGAYTHARNAVLTSHQGSSFLLQNEPSLTECSFLPLPVVGHLSIPDDRIVLFMSDDFSSEIGILNTKFCKYEKVANSRCLNFKREHLITAVYKSNFDCSESIYFADGLNPRRVINLSNIPFKYTLEESADGCDIKEYTDEVDCDRLLVDSNILYPTLELKLSSYPGNLRNGSYQAVVAYTSNRQRVTDYMSVTSPQPIFSHDNRGKSLDVYVGNLDRNFEEYELVIIYTVNGATTAERVGYFSTAQELVSVTVVGNAATANEYIPLNLIIIPRARYGSADMVAESNGHLLWTNPTTKKELNYQKQALNITAKWVAYKVSRNYYRNGGNKVGYRRDEVYTFYIQWLYKDGSFSPAYHIPGRAAEGADRALVSNADAYEMRDPQLRPDKPLQTWQVYNTAKPSSTPLPPIIRDNQIIGEGDMGFFESTRTYPDNVELYGDLACKNILLHKMPDHAISHIHLNDSTDSGPVLLGMRFSNIERPKNDDGTLVEDIVGYRIVRGDSTNNKTVLANGLIFNMGQYDNPSAPEETEKVYYANYPYNDLRKDPFLSATPVKGGYKQVGRTPLGTFSNKLFTFHSPTTSFNNIPLGGEFKIYTEEIASVTGKFQDVHKHPQHKLIKDFALLLSAAIGTGEGVLAIRGKQTIEVQDPDYFSPGIMLLGAATQTVPGGALAALKAYAAYLAKVNAQQAAQIVTGNIGQIVGAVAGLNAVPSASNSLIAEALVGGVGGFYLHGVKKLTEQTASGAAPAVLGAGQKIIMFAYFFAQGTATAINVIRSFVPFQQYAKQYVSHGFYSQYTKVNKGFTRRGVSTYQYLYPTIQQVGNYKVNNFKRESSVMLELSEDIARPFTVDDTRKTIKDAGLCDDPDKEFKTTSSAFYGAVKTSRPDVYGQVDTPNLIDTGYTYIIRNSDEVLSTGVVFGGDTYVTRFTLKRKMHYFNQFLFQERDGLEFNYRKYYNMPYARFWMDSFEYDLSELFKLKLPNDMHCLDCRKAGSIKINDIGQAFVVKDAYFYLFNSGVVDFYCESEINTDHRDWEEQASGRHYDSSNYTDLATLFRSDVIDNDNMYIYDKSLSKQLTETYIQKQAVDYNPITAEKCYTKYTGRVVYSLPTSDESKADNWRVYLANNYYDFPKSAGNVSGIKSIGMGQIVFFFTKSAPFLHRSVDTLKTDTDLKITIGDGGLFSTNPTPMLVTDYDYGSCQSGKALLHTQSGIIYPSQSHGKIFMATTSLEEISDKGMSRWFSQNMPYNLTKDFPEFPYIDNPLLGVGYLTAYDSNYNTAYITKRDYKIKDSVKKDVYYNVEAEKFQMFGASFALGDPFIFEDASWTVSYNLKTGSWVSYHDWHPENILQSSTSFYSIKNFTVWSHNKSCTSYCEFYGIKYPFEIEFISGNGADVGVLRSVEYAMECYKYSNSCKDYNHLLDFNFDSAIIYNSEQNSGNLNLKLAAKNNLLAGLNYPNVRSSGIDIEYSKEEQRYRFNQFWDCTKQRGEFKKNFTPMFNTPANGYVKQLNKDYLDYGKSLYERKKFRHMWHKILLRRMDCEDVKMVFKFGTTKQLRSIR
jgi:hypothetical protein